MTARRPGALRRIATRMAVGALAGALASTALVAVSAPGAAAASPGATDSAVTVSGRGEFASMKFTVSQTRSLTDQAITVSWTGGVGTGFAGTAFDTDFVQIMQCWGDDDGTVKENPGPPRTQCEFGASPTTNRGTWPGNGHDDTRQVTYSAAPSHYGQDDTYGAGMMFGGEVPFRSVDGEVISSNTQNNKLYNYNTTNEVDFARTSPDGTGTQIFETQTVNEAPQLGCGAPIRKGGTVTGRSCWLVIVPQGHLDLDGKPYQDQTLVNAGSPVSSTNWKNRVAVKLDFKPVQTSCAIGAKEQATTGSELVAEAITSWQAKLCNTGTVYSYTQLGDADARGQLGNGQAELAFTSRALGADEGTAAPADSVVYAPVALSGVVIGFNIERQPSTGASPEEKARAGTLVQQLKLTPRLVAKLLTESYRNSPWGAVSGGTVAPGYSWAQHNPAGLVTDPDFLALNPEFRQMAIAENPSTDTDLMTALGHADAARALWAYVQSDAAARRFLAGIPDEWGMRVNPYYATNADVNPTHTAFTTDRDDYPKNDPWSRGAPGVQGTASNQSMTDFHPYVDDMHAGALHARRGDQLWKSTWDALAVPPAWTSPGPQIVGSRFQIVVTDAASAARYGLQTAQLLNAAGRFVAPSTTSLTAAATHASTDHGLQQTTPDTTAAAAYPGAMLVYAAVRPARLKPAERASYAALLAYAAGAGQTLGVELGDLPLGYAPLPSSLKAVAVAAARKLSAFAGRATPAAGSTSAGATGGSGGGGAGSTGSGATGSTGASGGAAGAPAVGSPSSAAARPAVTPDLETTASGTTPADPAVPLRWAVPAGAGLGLLAALVAPLAGGWRPRPRAAPAAIRSLPARRVPRRLPSRFPRWRKR
ncbi:hypothetical protein [Streptacidiphilus monticola]|uniref:Uncharacterized protein n=1 Tax=Streptacidiphilus monticola TaxID=2161674 RepID=A0ABW1G4M5_9ACTN